MKYSNVENARQMHHEQQNKWYPQMCLLAHFDAALNFSRSEFTCILSNSQLIVYGIKGK